MLPNQFDIQGRQQMAVKQAEQKAIQDKAQQEALEKKRQFEQELLANGGYVVSPEILEENEPLRRAGLMEGDYLVPDPEQDGFKYLRNNSKEPKGMVITKEVFAANPDLEEAGLEVGDQLEQQEDGTFKPYYSGYNKSLKNFAYYAQKTDWVVDKLNDYALAEMGTGASTLATLSPALGFAKEVLGFLDASEYGKDFDSMSPEQRRERIAEVKITKLKEKYPDLIPEEDTLSAGAGVLAKSVVDPAYVAMPFGNAAKMVGSAYTIGALDTVANQLQETGKVDANKAVTDALQLGTAIVVGAKAIPAVAKLPVEAVKAVGKIPKGVSKVAQGVSKAVVSDAKKKGIRLSKAINTNIELGDSAKAAFEKARASLSMSAREATEVMTNHMPAADTVGSIQRKMVDLYDNSLASSGQLLRTFSKATDDYLGMVSTRVKNISPAVWGRLNRFEREVMTETKNYLQRLEPVAQQFKQLTGEDAQRLTVALQRGKVATENFLRSRNIDVGVYGLMRTVLDDVYKDLKDAGFNINRVQDYMPRVVKQGEYENLMKAINQNSAVRSKVEEAWNNYAKFTGRMEDGRPDVSKLTREEKARVTDMVLSGYDLKPIKTKGDEALAMMWRTSERGVKFGFVKSRKIDDITMDIAKYYEDPITSLQYYIASSVNKVQKRKLFANQFIDTSKAKDMDMKVKDYLELEAEPDALGMFVTDLVESGKVSSDNQDELIDLLNARFGKGEQSADMGFSVLRDLGYLGTIANPMSAATNFSDLAFAMFEGGVKNAFRSFFGKKDLKMMDLGLQEASQEFQDTSKMANILGKMFKYSGFQFTDRLGKETIINASMKRHSALAKTEKGRQKIIDDWSEAFGDEGVDNLVQGLRDGEINREVKDFLFMRLSKYQPISKLESSKVYMNNPNGRIFYMLKSFMLKQYDLIRNDIYKEIKSGNKKEGFRKLALLSIYLGATTTSTSIMKDFIRGRDIEPDRIPNRFMWQTLGVFGFDKYSYSRYAQRGDFTGWLNNQVMPAIPLVNALGEGLDAATYVFDDEKEASASKLIRPLPIFGDLTYNWFLGGAEKYNKRVEGERKAREKEEQQ